MFKRSLGEMIWSRFERTDNGCWDWTGTIDQEGYGRLKVRPKQYRAHRLVYEVLVGPIPEGLTLDHLCRNRKCVNPAHLEPVTDIENVKRGESPHACNARKTHCKYGHEFDSYFVNRKGKKVLRRKCPACQEIRKQKDREKAEHIGGIAWRAFQTHCKHGHEFTEENTIHRNTGGRTCRACNLISQRKAYYKRKQRL